jgi:hypothetical protein
MTHKEEKILELIQMYGGCEEAHHKQWVLDQIVHIITGAGYGVWIKQYECGECENEIHEWDIGVAP